MEGHWQGKQHYPLDAPDENSIVMTLIMIMIMNDDDDDDDDGDDDDDDDYTYFSEERLSITVIDKSNINTCS